MHPTSAHCQILGAPVARYVLLASALVALLLSPALAAAPAAQRNAPAQPALVIPSMRGGDLFEFYCSSCHGRGGRGDGPAAAALKTAPPDLTTITRRNGGTFPAARVHRIVAQRGERPMPAHGSVEMPVWGPIFSGLDANEAANRVRLQNIVDYLASIQVE